MNKLSKLFLVIIMILVITLGIMIYLYFNLTNEKDKLVDSNKKAVTELYKKTLAIENAGLTIQVQEDGSYVLVERNTPIERTDE